MWGKRFLSIKTKSIMRKITFAVTSVVFIGLLIVGSIIISITDKTIMANTQRIQGSITSFNAAKIDSYFAKYSGIVMRNSYDYSVISMLNSGTTIYNYKSSPYYQTVHKTLGNISKENPDVLSAYVVSKKTNFGMDGGTWISNKYFDLPKRPYNIVDEDNKKFIVTNPFKDLKTGDMVVAVAAPVINVGDKIIGVSALDIPIKKLNDMILDSTSGYKSGQQLLIGKDNLVICNTEDTSKVLVPLSDLNFGKKIFKEITDPTGKCVKGIGFDGKKYFVFVEQLTDIDWKIVSLVPASEYLESSRKLLVFIAILFLFSTLVIEYVVSALSSHLIRPIKQMTDVVRKLAKGNLDTEVNYKSDDELGILADSISKLVERLKTNINYIDEISSILETLGEGNFKIEFKLDYENEFKRIHTSLCKMKDLLQSSIEDIFNAAHNISEGASHIAYGSQNLATASSDQAESVNKATETLRVISKEVKAYSTDTLGAVSDVKQLLNDAHESSDKMKNLIEVVDKIHGTTIQISNFLHSIGELADQANTLSENATSKSKDAHLSEEDFYMITNQTKSLASQAAVYSKTSSVLIKSCMDAVESSNSAAVETEQALMDVINRISDSTEKIKIISEESQKQSKKIDDLLDTIESINSIIEQNAATAQEYYATSEELAGNATIMVDISEKFKF